MNPMELTWSMGKTIFSYPVPEDRAIDKDPADMSLDELIATQDREIPTISRISWKLTGQGTWSTDRPNDGDNEEPSTIAEHLPDDHELKAGWKTEKQRSEMTLEQLRAFDKWCAEHTRGTNLIPYRTIHPLTKWRIQNERDSIRTKPEVSYRIIDQHGTDIVAIRGRKLTAAEYVTEAKKYLRLLRDQYGHVPTLDELGADHAETKALYDAVRRGEVGFRKFDYQVLYLMADETDPYRENFFDELLHSSYEALEEPFIDEAFIRSAGLDPDDVADKMPRQIMLHFRSKRDRTRYLVNREHNDAFWHARLGQPLEIGEDVGYQSKGRRVTLNDRADQLPDLEAQSVNALSTLRD